MNLYAAVQTAHGTRVKRAGILRRRKNLTSNQGLWEFFTAYADETTKVAYVGPPVVQATSEADYLAKILSGDAPLRPEIDYVPARNRVTAFGDAARPGIYGTHRIEDLPDKERLTKLRKWWLQTTADEATKAHHLVFTLDPRLTAAMSDAKISADAFLLTAVSNAFAEFESRFHPGDTMSYLVALHHDRAHIHAHVLVHPRTRKGARVNLSILRRYKVGDRTVDVPCQQVLKDVFEREAEAACERYLPRAQPGLAAARARREEVAEELMLLARGRLEPEAKNSEGPKIERLVEMRQRLLGQPDYLGLVRQGRDAEAHLIAEDLADGRRYELRHNFASIADKSAQAQAETATQARAVLDMFSATLVRPAAIYLEGVGVPLPSILFAAEEAETRRSNSFQDELQLRHRRFRQDQEMNERLRQETMLLRARIVGEDRTEVECAVASAHTVLSLLEAAAPTLGDGPDLLSLWTPSQDGKPRLKNDVETSVTVDERLTRHAAELAGRHQPVNLAEFGTMVAAVSAANPVDEVQSFQLVGAPPSFWGRAHDVRVDELLHLQPLTPVRDASPTPG